MAKLYINKTVDVAATERMKWIFDTFQNVVVSISGGKDSTVLFDLAQKEAKSRGRNVTAFFLDQEAEYRSTIEHIRDLMTLGDHVIPMWFQVPIYMTNATSYEQDMLHAWGAGEEWIRPKEANSIHEAPGAPDRFYPFFDWFEQQFDAQTTCFLVGLRSEESLNRYRAVTKHPAIEGVPWSSKSNGGVKLYPIYDFTFEDIWTYLGKFKVPYNKAYDWMWIKEFSLQEMRVSNLIHEKAFYALGTLQEFEADTFEALQRRLDGVHTASMYAKEQTMYNTLARPAAYKTWRAYRDFLLTNLQNDKAPIFQKRFDKQGETEQIARQQCKQLLVNDWENSIPVIAQKDNQHELNIKKWMDLL